MRKLAKRGGRMKVVRYNLAHYLDTHGITRYRLAQRTGIQYHIIDDYYKNRVTRLDTGNLGRILDVLDCRLEDILTVDEIEENIKQ